MYKDTCQDKSHKTGPIFMAWNACDDERKRAADTSSIGPILQGTDIRDNNVRVKDEIKTKCNKSTILNYLIIIIMTLVSSGVVLNRGSVCVAK